jgi:Fe-S oxidoreductase
MWTWQKSNIGVPLRSRLFAHIETLNRWGSRLAPVSNWVMQNTLTRQLFQHALGIAPARRLPPFARPTLVSWYAQHRRHAGTLKGQKVILFNDCFMTYNYPQVGRATIELLERAGFEVLLVDKACCGRPMISKGLVEEARHCAARNVKALERYAAHDIPIVGCEPSCLLTLRDEYLDLIQGEAVKGVSQQSLMIEEFLVRASQQGQWKLKPRRPGTKLLLHGHCHQKTHIGTAPLVRCLQELGGFEVNEVDSGCCGMAGSFGFEAEHYALSQEIGQRRLFPAVKAASMETQIVATGVSCRQQIEHGTGRTARHPVELLAEACQDAL